MLTYAAGGVATFLLSLSGIVFLLYLSTLLGMIVWQKVRHR